MPGYRFCRTDDLPLLAEACRRCGEPPFTGGEPVTPDLLKRWIREWQLWCSSCMVAFEGDSPVAVLLATKASDASSILWLAVHREHRRRGHARHMLRSLAQKLSILGPPCIYAEVPADDDPARQLFESLGFEPRAELTDYVVEAHEDVGGLQALAAPASFSELLEAGAQIGGDPKAPRAWWRRRATLERMSARFQGLALSSGERLEAWVLLEPGRGAAHPARALASGCAGDRASARLLALLLCHAAHRSGGTLELPRLAPGEIAPQALEGAPARPARRYRLLAADAPQVGGEPA